MGQAMVPARTRRRGKTALDAGVRCAPRPVAGIDEEQRRRLIECCAFFKASRYRPVRPGQVRAKDLQRAEIEIDSVLGRRRLR